MVSNSNKYTNKNHVTLYSLKVNKTHEMTASP